MAAAGQAIDVAVASTDHLRMVEQVALAYPGFAPRVTLLGQKGLSRWLRDIGLFRNPRLPMLIDALPFLRQFDAIVVPERTTTAIRSEEHTSELQSLMRISYAVFCLKKKQQKK